MNAYELEAKHRYNKVAQQYHEIRTHHPQGWFFNELLEMPATLTLLGNVKGKKILDFGCGTGIYAKKLTQLGALVKGFDISEEMLAIARRNNPNLDLREGSGYKIPFKEKFDVVYAALVLDYFHDLDKPLQEIRRVLKDGGYFVFSIGNPVSETIKKIVQGKKRLAVLGVNDYFKEGKIYGKWRFDDGTRVKMPTWHKTYETIITTLLNNGFQIEAYKDAAPLPKAKKLFPRQYRLFKKYPFFCIWKVRKV